MSIEGREIRGEIDSIERATRYESNREVTDIHICQPVSRRLISSFIWFSIVFTLVYIAVDPSLIEVEARDGDISLTRRYRYVDDA